MNEQVWWYLARAAGLVAMVLLVAASVLGVLFTTRAMRAVDRPAWLLAMHRWVGMLVVVATALHLAGLVLDSHVHFGWREVLVPGTSAWRPLAVGIGVAALHLLVAVWVTSLLMRRIPKRWWRAIHTTSYALTWLALVHAALAGTDVGTRAYAVGATLLVMVATGAALSRVVLGRGRAAGGGATSSRGATPAARNGQRRPPATEEVGAGKIH